ncbi:hypothetical protein [Streptomyces eurocidicus]|uniref:Uncharacterized protein n=1 Tax=Streptomyces eurocidicus TaxID=66423 RepID=A0A7W8B4H9_STREU|nr:hypothetical protein [Streptomyces eurocidicus]MBB5116617.1 hypothetical protein [Streptomyces eurocidicus]MBF6052381.1 hypothetical protein [Streptomyces eurocidicus]
MTTDLALLTTAAAQWDAAAKDMESVQKTYNSQVRNVGIDDQWQGVARTFAQLANTRTYEQYTAAATEARAIASLLRDAHAQFVDLRGKLKAAVAEAAEKDMKIDDNGKATWTKRNDPGVKNDPDAATAIPKAEAAWTERIADFVQQFDDADQGVKLALAAATQDSDPNDGIDHGFNAKAEGDIEVVEGRRQAELATKLNSTGHLNDKEMAEMRRLFRDNGKNKEFSQTLLNTLGSANTIKFTNKMNDLAYFDDKKHKDDYLSLEKGMAVSLATGTRAPDFKGQDGKPLKYGSAAYTKAYQDWLKSPDARFYNHWREDLRKTGIDQYKLKAATEKTNVIAMGHDQKVRGYQGLLTLMQQGGSYSPQFLADVTDDMVAAEKKDKNLWDLHGTFEGKNDGWFANDPVDAALGIMSRDPDTATAYLDPGAGGKDAQHRNNERLNYFLHDRDWDVTNTTKWNGNIEHRAGDTEDKDSRVGLGAALEAAATGREPGSPVGKPGPHSEGQARVMQDTIATLDLEKGGQKIHPNLQQPVGHALVDYVADTHEISKGRIGEFGRSAGKTDIWSDNGRSHITVPPDSLIRVMRGAAENDSIFAQLYEAERFYGAEALVKAAKEPGVGRENWAVPIQDTAGALGTLNAIGADKYLDQRDDKAQWANDMSKHAYHVGGTPITMIPIVGDEAQRVLDEATYAWAKDVISEADLIAQKKLDANRAAGIDGTNELIDSWAKERKIPAKIQTNEEWQENPALANLKMAAGQESAVRRNNALDALGRH